MKHLTILIPTYNRASKLLRLLEIINRELISLENSNCVNVIIRDNSQNNETKDAIEAGGFLEKAWIDYKKNTDNLGFDGNVLNLFVEAQGEYVWFIGDDDVLFEGSIKRVLELLDLNAAVLHLPFKQPQDLEVPQYQTSPHLKYWNSVPEIVEQVLKNIKITSFVYKKESIAINTEELTRLYGTSGWMHVILAFEILANLKKPFSVSITDFLAGSLDTEWKVIEWLPSAYLSSKTFYHHKIFNLFPLSDQIKKFENSLYFNGIDMTLKVIMGEWGTKVPIEEYVSFGRSYPFRKILFGRPAFLTKFLMIKFKLGSLLKPLLKKKLG